MKEKSVHNLMLISYKSKENVIFKECTCDIMILFTVSTMLL